MKFRSTTTTPIVVSMTGGGSTTASTVYVSSGVGITIKAQSAGNIIVQSVIEGDASGTITRIWYVTYRSTVGIPAVNTAPNIGDVALAFEAYIDPTTVSFGVAIPLLSPSTGLTSGTSYYFYVAYKSATGVGSAEIKYLTIVGTSY